MTENQPIRVCGRNRLSGVLQLDDRLSTNGKEAKNMMPLLSHTYQRKSHFYGKR